MSVASARLPPDIVPSIAEIESAIEATLAALVAVHPDPPLPRPSDPATLIGAPVIAGLMHALTELGWVLFVAHGESGLDAVAERVVHSVPNQYHARLGALMNAWWEVGNWA